MSTTLCSMLWNHQFWSPQGEVKPCCRFRMEGVTDAPSIRAAMQAGERVAGCRRCHEEEDAGKESLRMRYNRDPILGLESLRLEEPRITWLEISLSNRCNVACRMCDSRYSSRWAPEERLLGRKPSPSFTLDLGKLRELVPSLRHVKITGGEPLIDPAHEEFLGIMTSVQPERVFLNYSTNLTRLPSRAVIESWRRFHRVELALSLDSVNPAEMNYLRYPTNGEEALANVERYIALREELPSLHLVLRPTVSIFNVHSIPETYLWWFERKGERMRENATHLTYPAYLSPTRMLPIQKERVSRHFDRHRVHPGLVPPLDYLERHFRARDESAGYPEFVKRTRELDRLREQDYLTLFPHLRDE